MDSLLQGGFADPVLHSQASFRAIMDALANPGTPQNLVTPPSISHSLSPELVSTLLTLSDHDTPVWLDAGLRATGTIGTWLGFHSGAPLVEAPEKAVFAAASGAGQLPALDQFNLGTQEYPDRSTTIVLAVPALSGGDTLVLRGPGIKDHLHISPKGLPADFVAQWTANRALFPRGVDLLLVAQGQVMGLPRSTRIAEGH
jgi:alpha-D-ribose 1-methylphosphonate 5-triphosphate synthase subunit PhnH